MQKRLSQTILALLAAAAALVSACTHVAFSGPSFEPRTIQAYVAAGHLREERAPKDAPYTNRDLADHFAKVAFGYEAHLNDGDPGPEFLRRWEGGLKWRAYATGEAGEVQRQLVQETFDRLSAASGLRIEPAGNPGTPNVFIMFPGREDAEGLLAAAQQLEDRGRPGLAQFLRDGAQDPNAICRATMSYPTEDSEEDDWRRGEIGLAFVVIRSGLAPRLQHACIEEELTQILGLANDNDAVRPSIFNDDQEFALLTEHDEWLLKILYHPSLRPGMSRTAASALVPGIIEDLRPEGG